MSQNIQEETKEIFLKAVFYNVTWYILEYMYNEAFLQNT